MVRQAAKHPRAGGAKGRTDKSPSTVTALRLQVMRAISAHLKTLRGTQGEQADGLEISRPRLNALLKERVELFGLDSLAQIAMRAGLSVRLSVKRSYVRRRR